MKKVLFPLALLVSIVLDAQEFDLNKYKYRFQRYQSAQFNFLFNSSNNYRVDRTVYINKQANVPDQHYNSDKNTLNIELNLPFSFYRVINTEKLQHNQNLSYDLNLSSNNEIRNKWKGVYHNLNYENNNRSYKGLHFNELNFTINGGNSYFKTFIDNPARYLNYSNLYHTIKFDISAGKGKGRLEFVGDAVTTMFLLQDLKKKAGIGNYTNEQIENIAKGITKINNTRFIDYRYRLIDQLTLLDSTLKSNGIEPTSAIKYFTTINDNWLYATRFQRYSGSRWSVNYNVSGGSYYVSRRNKDSDTGQIGYFNFQNNNLYNGLKASYAWSKQIGLKVQRSFNASLGGGYNFNTQMWRNGDIFVVTGKSKPDNITSNLELNYGYLYQPNTRTYITFDINLLGLASSQLNGMRVSDPSNIKNINLNAQLYPKLSIFKFFNPHLYYNFTATVPIQMAHSKFSGDNRLTNLNTTYDIPASIRMGFTYNFF